MCNKQASATQSLLRRHREVLPQHYLNDFDVNRNSHGDLHFLMQTLPKRILYSNSDLPDPSSAPTVRLAHQADQKRKKNYWSEEETCKLEEALVRFKKNGSRR